MSPPQQTSAQSGIQVHVIATDANSVAIVPITSTLPHGTQQRMQAVSGTPGHWHYVIPRGWFQPGETIRLWIWYRDNFGRGNLQEKSVTYTALAQSVSLNPPSATLAPGQNQQFTPTVVGVASPRLRWNLIGPRVSGTDWGTLTDTGLYTAPAAPPPGQVKVVVKVLGQWGEPVATAFAPITITSPLVDPWSCQGDCECPSGIPADQMEPKVLQAKAYLDMARAHCDNQHLHQHYLYQAETLWQSMSKSEKIQLVTLLGKSRLGPNVCFVIASPDPQVQNPARVTASGGIVTMTLGGNAGGIGLSILDIELTKNWPNPNYTSVLDFLCYELEVVRIRAMIDCYCTDTEYDAMKQTLDRLNGRLSFYRNKTSQQGAYNQFMAQVRHSKKGLPYNYYASWMFEKIVARGGNDPDKTCDLPLDFDSPNSPYQKFLDEDIEFEHDVDATALGKMNCLCCGCPEPQATSALKQPTKPKSKPKIKFGIGIDIFGGSRDD